jgi:alpha-L-arabinofuranosidase
MGKSTRLTMFSAWALMCCAAVGMVPAGAAGRAPVSMVVQANAPGPTIDRHIFGQFAEHLGHGIYGGVWVGPGSSIPNTDG